MNAYSLSIVTLGLLALASPAQRTQPWDPEVVDMMGLLPVQEGGRVKPLESVANFTLLGMHGKRSITTPLGEKLTAMEWLMDVMFYPEAARSYQLFKVPDSETIEAMGLAIPGKSRADRYSFNELGPGLDRLIQQYNEYAPRDRKELTRIQGQLVDLGTNVLFFDGLSTYLNFARHHFPVGDGPRVRELFEGSDHAHYSDVIAVGPALRGLWDAVSAAAEDDPDRRAALALLSGVSQHGGGGKWAILPPAGSVDEQPGWSTPAELGTLASAGGRVPGVQIERLRGFERLMDSLADPQAFKATLAPLSRDLIAGAERRNEYGTIPMEVTYYRLGLVNTSLALFILSFLVVVATWLAPRVKLLHRAGWWTVLAANLVLTTAIVMRCIIRARPPVSTLYETILFIVAVLVFVGLFMERVNRQKIALVVSSVLGVVGVFLANKFEVLEGPKDSMPMLQAVLDTNFWLATHVTSITIGYAAGLLAAGIGSFYLLAKLVGWRKSDKSMYKSIARMTYGVICFGLLFSVVGTILGGIWANDSWGRFWGWDPKENGALLICIAMILVVHGRMSGLLRDHGVCAMSAFTGTVVAFSWFGTNLLGVGLHSYGFTQGVSNALWTYYIVQWGIIGLGFVPLLMARHEQRILQEVERRSQGGQPPAGGSPA